MARSRTEKTRLFAPAPAGIACAALAVLVASCGGGATTTPSSSPPPGARPAAGLAAYQGSDAQLFDDAIEPSSVGLADVTFRAHADPALRNRTLKADVVTRMRVSTVTVDVAEGQPTYHVQLSWVGAPFVQRGFPDTHLELAIRPDSPAFGVVKWLDTRLIGKTFVGFVRRFAGPEEASLHFHLSADSADVAAAIEEVKTLGEAAGY